MEGGGEFGVWKCSSLTGETFKTVSTQKYFVTNKYVDTCVQIVTPGKTNIDGEKGSSGSGNVRP